MRSDSWGIIPPKLEHERWLRLLPIDLRENPIKTEFGCNFSEYLRAMVLNAPSGFADF